MEKLTAIYEHTDDGWWVVSVPEIPGAQSPED
jgi:predicted RNase H-like HicB family nuclease